MAMTGGTAKLVKEEYTNYGKNNWTVKLYVYYKTSQDNINNKSTITCGMYVVTPYDIGSWDDFNGSYVGTSSLTFDGTIPKFSGTRWLVENKSFTVNHNPDGTGTATISWKWGVNSPWGRYQNPSGSFSITLPTIPRESSLSLSASTVNVGGSITANISRASSSFTHNVEFYINDTYYQKYTGVGTSQSYTIPTSWYNAMPSSTSCTAYCRITTYNGSTKIGDQVKKSFTVNVPSSVKPTIGTIELIPTVINNYSILVQGKNKLTINVSGCSAGTGSDIKSYAFSGPGTSSTTTSTSVSVGPISDTGTLTYTVKVTDQRGRTASKSATITCYAYSVPYFKSFSAYRADSSGTADSNGTYLKCTYSIAYADVNNTNSTSVNITYTTGDTSKTASVSDGSASINLGNNTSTYKVYAKVTDSYGGASASNAINIFGASRIFNATTDGLGLAIGKMSEKTSSDTNGLFECAFDAKFYKNITINDKTLLDWTHPVGSIYQSTASTNPANLFGGTWEPIEDTFLLAAGSTYSAGDTGGESSHTLTISEMPSHEGHLYSNDGTGSATGGNINAFLNRDKLSTYDSSGRGWVVHNTNEVHPVGFSRGESQAHNNMPPYLAVYMWERTA